jgi:hypothetical protein
MTSPVPSAAKASPVASKACSLDAKLLDPLNPFLGERESSVRVSAGTKLALLVERFHDFCYRERNF